MVFLHWVNFVIRKRNSCSHIMRGSWRQHCDHLRVNEPCTHCLTFCFVFFASKRVSEPKALKDASHTVQKNPTQSHYLNADGIAISRNFKQLRRTIHLIFFVVHTPESIYRPSWTEQKYCLCIVMASDSQIQKWWKLQIINTIRFWILRLSFLSFYTGDRNWSNRVDCTYSTLFEHTIKREHLLKEQGCQVISV